METATSNDVRHGLKTNQNGFSLLEVVIAIMILTIGLLATAAAISYALEFSSISKNASNARLVIVSAIEEVDNLRNTQALQFKQIANVGAVDNNGAAKTFTGFTVGFQDVSTSPGEDGVNGTPDDFTNKGPDGNWGTGDDFTDDSLVRSGYQRKITITELSPALKRIEVIVRYVSRAGKIGELRGIAYFNDDGNVSRH